MKRGAWLALVLTMAALAGLMTARRASAIERNFAGSAQFDYMLAPYEHGPAPATPSAQFDGFTTEIALKLAVDVNDQLSANVKVCYGCHGFELALAHVDYRLSDEVNIRVGRFSPSFGAFNLRHDPANHRFSDKPLIYDMGRMLRKTAWNLGVIPAPFPDNGVELNGVHWFGEKTSVDYAVYAIGGLRGNPKSDDLDWVGSRQLYYVQKNFQPTVGARVSVTQKLGNESDVTVGATAQYGTYDGDAKFSYAFLGGDVSLRLRRTNLRFEWLARRQQIDVSDPSVWRWGVPASGGDFFVKQGGYVELEQPVSRNVDVMLRGDALIRAGNTTTASLLGENGKYSTVVRGSVGATWAFERALRLKASVELWRFSDVATDLSGRGQQNAISFHLGVVGTY